MNKQDNARRITVKPIHRPIKYLQYLAWKTDWVMVGITASMLLLWYVVYRAVVTR